MHVQSEDEEAGPASFEPVHPPVVLLGIAALAMITGVAVLAISSFTTHVVGYVVGTLLTVGFVAAFRRVDNGRRQSLLYVPRPSLALVAALILLGGLAGAVLHAWFIADHLARQ